MMTSICDMPHWLGQGPFFSATVLIRRGPLISDIPAKMSLPDEILNLVLEVVTFLRVVTVFSVETIIFPFIVSLGLCPDGVGGPEEPLASPSGVKMLVTLYRGRGVSMA
ncbi:hypothetical protein BHE74_00017388 [Ensete ventricosum]|uniref:Uncharacterized protein n=1 Tax=Ensete ventricosum TaxID=4639 RepID=A0A444D1B1_ENSVE|nr:hypothetical protein GW17_00045768 [Ensete ventricosum]RWW74670.1 hypothetical protein BHE74_00017388 [Ensete ventricosum]RZR72745.1 hypothetical protein BHM03_00016469 [Ensete ventricosum]